MPIPMEKFSDVQRPLDTRIVEYLASNAKSAFALTELVAALEGYKSDQFAQLFLTMDPAGLGTRYQSALARLLKEGQIERADHQGTTYYAISGPKQP